jgi:dipeptidase
MRVPSYRWLRRRLPHRGVCGLKRRWSGGGDDDFVRCVMVYRRFRGCVIVDECNVFPSSQTYPQATIITWRLLENIAILGQVKAYPLRTDFGSTLTARPSRRLPPSHYARTNFSPYCVANRTTSCCTSPGKPCKFRRPASLEYAELIELGHAC